MWQQKKMNLKIGTIKVARPETELTTPEDNIYMSRQKTFLSLKQSSNLLKRKKKEKNTSDVLIILRTLLMFWSVRRMTEECGTWTC